MARETKAGTTYTRRIQQVETPIPEEIMRTKVSNPVELIELNFTYISLTM